MRVLILGGYGVFGGRLAELVCDEPALHLLIAGRSLEKAQAFCRDLGGACGREALRLDRNGDLAAAFSAARPDLVVDATGPFQAYGERPYRVAEACIAVGADYMDLADDSAFVHGISSLDASAQGRGVSVLSGVSTCPVLTTAAVRRLSAGLGHVDEVAAGIAPSPLAVVGLNVLKAITSYAGRPVQLRRNGRDATGVGLAETLRFTIRPPGKVPLRPALFSLVDTPDLRILPDLLPELRDVWFGAGPRPEILHRMLITLARLRSLRLLPAIRPAAPLFHWVKGWLRWGEHRGGMFVRVRGCTADGDKVERSWHLIAGGDDGPMIPSLPAEGLIRRRLAGLRPEPGARPCVNELELEDYDRLFARWKITTGVRETPPADAPLYRRILGPAFDRLPAPIRAMHEVQGEAAARGIAEVRRGRGPFAALVATLIGAPRSGVDQPVAVTFRADATGETWTRNFAGRPFRSRQEAGQGRFDGLVVERFGPVAVGLALVVDGGHLHLVVRGWSLFGLPMPAWLGPGGSAFESVEDDAFHFDVDIRHRLFGRIVSYRGSLRPDRAGHQPSSRERSLACASGQDASKLQETLSP